MIFGVNYAQWWCCVVTRNNLLICLHRFQFQDGKEMDFDETAYFVFFLFSLFVFVLY